MSPSNRPGGRWVLLATVLVVTVIASSSTIGRVSATSLTTLDNQDPLQAASNRVSMLIKRSLCNTFGGCGAKRSFIEPASRGLVTMIAPTNPRESFVDAAPGDNINPSRDDLARQSTKTRPVGELFDDLFEYLQTGSRPGQAAKLILVVPGETLINAADQPADSVWPAKKQRSQRMLFN